MNWIFAIILALCCTASAAPAANLITNLPGWSPKQFPSKQYSGFVAANENSSMQMHYWFVEAEEDPDTAPLILWFNGGPGASSLYGLLIEMGPFRLSDVSLRGESYIKTGVPELIYNPNGWQKVANILALSIPPPVGFSYCTPPGPSSQGNDCGSWDDTSTAEVTYFALKSWMTLFPEYKQNEMFVMGESYAGVYVPMLAQQILQHPDNGINLKGIAVGDACAPPDVCGSKHGGPFYYIEFLYGKSAFSTKLYAEIHRTCSKEELVTGKEMTEACTATVDKIADEVGGYWMYAFYDDCWYENDIRRSLTESMTADHKRSYYGPPLEGGINTKFREITATGFSEIPNGYACGGPTVQKIYLGLDSVKEALHVPTDAVFFQCDNGNDFEYDTTQPDLISWYKEIIANETLRVLVYNGDADPCITAFQAETWTRSLGFKEKQAWRPWTTDNCNRMGGAVTRYVHGFDFVTIRGSGHMVPQFKPEVTLEFISRFIKDQDYKMYDPLCTNPSDGR